MKLSSIIKKTEPMFPEKLKELRAQLPYQLPKTHTSWRDLSAVAIACSEAQYVEGTDRATLLHGRMWEIWLNQKSPLCCLTTDALRDFEQTDCNDLASIIPNDWIPPLPLFLVSLPKNSLKTVEGTPIPYMMVILSHPEIDNVVASEHEKQVSFTALDNAGSVWMSGTGIFDGALIREDKQLGADPTSEQESLWLSHMTGLALQMAMTLSYGADELQAPAKVRGRALKQATGKGKAAIFPRWIGKQVERKGRKSIGIGNGGSKRTHWRRGHWRSQPCGTNRQQRKLIHIKPQLVNPS